MNAAINAQTIKHRLQLGHWNLNGLMSKQLGLKLENEDVLKVINSCHIFGITETHLLPSNGKQLVGYKDFHSFRKQGKRKNYNSGGISVYIRDEILDGVSVKHGETSDFIWVELKKKKQYFNLQENVHIGFVYIAPANSNLNDRDFTAYESLEKDVSKFSLKGDVMLLGDFNSRVAKMSDFIINDDDKHTPLPDTYISDENEYLSVRRNEDINTNEYGKHLLSLCQEHQLRIMNGRMLGDLNGKPTSFKWNGCSAVDYGIVNRGLWDRIDFFKVWELVGHISDHCPISCGFKCSYKIAKVENDIYPLKPNFKWDDQSEFIYKSALTSNSIGNQIESVLQMTESNLCIDEMLSKVENILKSAADGALKQRRNIYSKSKRKKKKWFDRDCYILRKDVLRLGRKMCRSKATHEQRTVFFSKKKELRKLVKFKKKEFRQNILNQLNNLEENNPRQYWKLVSELKDLESNKSCESECLSAQEWVTYFSDLLYNSNMENCTNLEYCISKMLETKTFSKLDYRITQKEIKYCISNLKHGKTVGMDRISAEMIKASTNQLLPVYEKLFNSIFRQGIYPNNWKESFIVPLFKSGSHKDPSNYRGIAINSALSKIFSMILTNRFESFAKENQLIDDTQIGFKKGCRTVDHMFILTTLIDKYVKKLKSPLYVCFVDFRKAYDRVWRQALLYKLSRMDINGMFFNIINSMYGNNKMCVRVNKFHRSHFFTSNVGVRQGDAISPILFNLYVADLKKVSRGGL